MKVKEGEYVKIVEREVTPADVKGGSFYPYFCGIAGTVDRVYDQEVCLKVDLETLPQDVLKRHLDIQESIKRKWLNGLSGEARNRLTPAEKQFQLSYTILVQSSDLEKAKPGEAKAAAIKRVQPLNGPEGTRDKGQGTRELPNAERGTRGDPRPSGRNAELPESGIEDQGSRIEDRAPSTLSLASRSPTGRTSLPVV